MWSDHITWVSHQWFSPSLDGRGASIPRLQEDSASGSERGACQASHTVSTVIHED